MTKKDIQKTKNKRQLTNLNPYLETNKAHKDWYNVFEMGKQRGKPKAVPAKQKKPKGFRPKHLHKG